MNVPAKAWLDGNERDLRMLTDLLSTTASANLPAVSGLEARHARKKGNPKHTMTIDLGRAYIGDLVAKWMDVIA